MTAAQGARLKSNRRYRPLCWRRWSCVITCLGAIAAAPCSHADDLDQATLTPTISGLVVSCRDSVETPVLTIFRPLNDAGIARVENGRPVIILDPGKMTRLNPLVRLFIYAHECAHHVSGDVIAGVQGRDHPNREQTADRIGIRFMRDYFHITQQQVDLIGETFKNNPPVEHHMSGPLRAKWISACYQTDDLQCSFKSRRTVAGTNQ